MIHLSTLLQHYKRREIQEEITLNAADKEIAINYNNKGFGKRPDILNYPADIMEFAQKGATSFHASEELWSNPLNLIPMMNRKEVDSLRMGWDLVLDVDTHFLEYSKIAADLIIKALKHNGVNSVSCKFSGNKGFHIAVPFQAFPERIGDELTKELFPEAPRKIAMYLREMIKKPLGEKILEYEKGDFSKVMEKTGCREEELKFYIKDSLGTKVPHLKAEAFLDIDTVLISSRHLYRMAYTFNEKSGLISVPVNPEKVLEFNKNQGKHPVDISGFRFLDRRNVVPGEARKLIMQSFDFSQKSEDSFAPRKEEAKQEYEIPETAAPEDYFPPCIQKGLKGLKDGKKRFLFILVNFLVSVGWDYPQIEELLGRWNKRNDEPLRDVNIKGHVRYHKTHRKKVLPPNCNNKMYYHDMGLCCPDNLCKRVKNPVNYVRRKTNSTDSDGAKSKKEKPKLTAKQEEFIRQRKEKEKEFREKMKERKKS